LSDPTDYSSAEFPDRGLYRGLTERVTEAVGVIVDSKDWTGAEEPTELSDFEAALAELVHIVPHRVENYAPSFTGTVNVPLPDSNPKTRFGVKKPSFRLIPGAALVHEAVVFMLGAAKYGPFNWRENKVSASVYVDAALRHIESWHDGEDVDPESGASHLAHARACLAIILDAMETGNLIDDRPLPGVTSTLIARYANTGSLAKETLN